MLTNQVLNKGSQNQFSDFVVSSTQSVFYMHQ